MNDDFSILITDDHCLLRKDCILPTAMHGKLTNFSKRIILPGDLALYLNKFVITTCNDGKSLVGMRECYVIHTSHVGINLHKHAKLRNTSNNKSKSVQGKRVHLYLHLLS